MPTGSLAYQTEDSIPDAIPGPIQGAFFSSLFSGNPSHQFRFNGTSKTYSPDGDVMFGSADLVFSDASEEVYRKTVQGRSYDFKLITPNSGYRLRYTRLAVKRSPMPPSYTQQSNHYIFFGIPTLRADMPINNAIPFPASSSVIGEAFLLVDGKRVRYTLTDSSSKLAIDAAAGVATIDLTLKGRQIESSAIVDLGSFTSSNIILASDGSFRSTSSASSVPLNTWCGFFGPRGVEAACYFSVTRGINGSQYQRDLFIIGLLAWGR